MLVKGPLSYAFIIAKVYAKLSQSKYHAIILQLSNLYLLDVQHTIVSLVRLIIVIWQKKKELHIKAGLTVSANVSIFMDAVYVQYTPCR